MQPLPAAAPLALPSCTQHTVVPKDACTVHSPPCHRRHKGVLWAAIPRGTGQPPWAPVSSAPQMLAGLMECPAAPLVHRKCPSTSPTIANSQGPWQPHHSAPCSPALLCTLGLLPCSHSTCDPSGGHDGGRGMHQSRGHTATDGTFPSLPSPQGSCHPLAPCSPCWPSPLSGTGKPLEPISYHAAPGSKQTPCLIPPS